MDEDPYHIYLRGGPLHGNIVTVSVPIITFQRATIHGYWEYKDSGELEEFFGIPVFNYVGEHLTIKDVS